MFTTDCEILNELIKDAEMHVAIIDIRLDRIAVANRMSRHSGDIEFQQALRPIRMSESTSRQCYIQYISDVYSLEENDAQNTVSEYSERLQDALLILSKASQDEIEVARYEALAAFYQLKIPELKKHTNG